jgi:hypothetical protein
LRRGSIRFRRWRDARPYAARIDQSAVRLVVAEQQRAIKGRATSGVRPPDNDELGSIEAQNAQGFGLALNPGVAIAGMIGAIEPLRDNAFEAMFARRPAKSFAIAAFLIAIAAPAGGFLRSTAERALRSTSSNSATFSPSR